MAQIIPNFLPEKKFDYSANVHTCCKILCLTFWLTLGQKKCYHNMQMICWHSQIFQDSKSANNDFYKQISLKLYYDTLKKSSSYGSSFVYYLLLLLLLYYLLLHCVWWMCDCTFHLKRVYTDYPCNITPLSLDLWKSKPLSHYESEGGDDETGETGRRCNSYGGKGDWETRGVQNYQGGIRSKKGEGMTNVVLLCLG